MFESAYNVLNQFIEREDRPLWRFDIHSVETVRSENLSELFYLCNVGNQWVIVFETDFVDRDVLRFAAKEANEVFGADGFKLLHWLQKKNPDGKGGIAVLDLPASVPITDLLYKVEGTYLQCAVIGVEFLGESPKHYDPEAYGYSS